MNLERMKKELGMKSCPECFAEIYEKIKNEWKQRSKLILSEGYVERILTDAKVLLPYMDTVLSAAAKVRKNEALCLLVCILETWVKNGGDIRTPDYMPPEGPGLDFDFFHLFAAVPTIPDSVKFHRDRNVPEDIIAATLQEYDYCFEMCRMNIGRIAFDKGRLVWICHTINNELIRIGRFKYELPTKRVSGVRVYKNSKGEILTLADGLHIHRTGRIVGSIYCEEEADSFVANITETENEIVGHVITDGNVAREKTSFSRSEWELCLSKDDAVIPVHIPRDGDFDVDTIESSYARLREVMTACFADMPYKAIHCHTWMMSRDLRKVLKPTSNILAFQKKYIHYPCKSEGTWVFGFVFPGEKGISGIESLSEGTSLQRNVKELYKNGGAIYDECGFFF